MQTMEKWTGSSWQRAVLHCHLLQSQRCSSMEDGFIAENSEGFWRKGGMQWGQQALDHQFLLKIQSKCNILMPQERSLWFIITSRTPLLAVDTIPPSRDRELGVPATAGELSRSKKEQHSRRSSMKSFFSSVIKAGQSQRSSSIRNKWYCCSLSNFPAVLLRV